MADATLKYEVFVRMVLDAIETSDIPYLIGGAVAVWAYGDPRATRDLDLVVQISEDGADQLSKELEKRDMFLPAETIQERLKDRRDEGPLHAFHGKSGFKADLYFLREGDTFRKEAFQRRALVNLGPGLGEVYLHTPEDLIINKLHYYSINQQTKHLRDIASIIHSLGDELDEKYLEKWFAARDLQTLWKSIQRKIQTQL
jgi:hypothetical protein